MGGEQSLKRKSKIREEGGSYTASASSHPMTVFHKNVIPEIGQFPNQKFNLLNLQFEQTFTIHAESSDIQAHHFFTVKNVFLFSTGKLLHFSAISGLVLASKIICFFLQTHKIFIHIFRDFFSLPRE